MFTNNRGRDKKHACSKTFNNRYIVEQCFNTNSRLKLARGQFTESDRGKLAIIMSASGQKYILFQTRRLIYMIAA